MIIPPTAITAQVNFKIIVEIAENVVTAHSFPAQKQRPHYEVIARKYASIFWAAEVNTNTFRRSTNSCNGWDCCFRRIFDISTSFVGYLSVLSVLCVCKNTETEETVMTNQIPVNRCQYCGCTDIRIGWQPDEALVTFKKHGWMGNRLRLYICGRCGAVLYQCVAEPHKFPQAR